MEKKASCLKEIIKGYKRLAVAFSAGVDSAYLLHVANEVLGSDCIAITVSLVSGTAEEIKRARDICAEAKIRHICCEIDELSIEGFAHNPPDRCYICKKAIFAHVKEIAKELQIEVVADGSNADDINDYRPGMKALKEMGVVSPLMEAGLTKQEIRLLSREAGLSTWSLPSSPCLSSRIPYGEVITPKKLSMIEQSEGYLRFLGFSNCRVRTHGPGGELARIEVDRERIRDILKPDIHDSIVAHLKDIGYSHICVDMEGFKSGSLNNALIIPPKSL